MVVVVVVAATSRFIAGGIIQLISIKSAAPVVGDKWAVRFTIIIIPVNCVYLMMPTSRN